MRSALRKESSSEDDSSDSAEVEIVNLKKKNPEFKRRPLPPLKDITSKTLKEVFRYGTGKNPSWICPCCGHSAFKIERLLKHAESHEAEEGLQWKKMLALHRRLPFSEEEEVAKGAGEQAKRVKQSDLRDWSIDSIKTEFLSQFTRFLVAEGLPLSMTESPSLRSLTDTILKLGRAGEGIKLRFGSQDLMPARRQLTPVVAKSCEEIFQNFIEPKLQSVQLTGCTLIQDGRSNINHDPLIASGVQTLLGFVPLGTIDAGAEKKGIAFNVKLVKRYVDDNDLGMGFGRHTYGVCLDGTAANITALQQIERDMHLIPIRCQSHALALLLKKTFLNVFARQIKDAEEIISFVRSHGRVNSTLKKRSGGLVLLRFVPTRFNTHAIALDRLCHPSVKAALTTLATDKEYQEYIADSNKAIKTAAQRFDTIVKSEKDFWEPISFACAVTKPVTAALRLMDTSVVRAQHGYDIWAAIGSRIASVLVDDKWKAVPVETKQKIYRLYCEEWAADHYPVLGAGYLLHPKNMRDVRKMAVDKSLDLPSDDFDEMLRDTKRCIDDVVTRMFEGEDSAVAETKCTSAKNLLDAYINGGGDFATRQFDPKGTADEFWSGSFTLLGRVARIILNIAIAVSDIERLHKVYSNVHTPSRNRLRNELADKLALANLALREERRSEKQEAPKDFRQWLSYIEVSKFDADYDRWVETIRDVQVRVESSVAAGRSEEVEGLAVGTSPDVDMEMVDATEAEPNPIFGEEFYAECAEEPGQTSERFEEEALKRFIEINDPEGDLQAPEETEETQVFGATDLAVRRCLGRMDGMRNVAAKLNIV